MGSFEPEERAAKMPKLIKSGREPGRWGPLWWHGSQEELFHHAARSKVTAITRGRGGRLGLCARSAFERRVKFGDAHQENSLEVVDGGRVGCSNPLQTLKRAAKMLDFLDGWHRCLRHEIHSSEQILPLILPKGSDLRH